MHCKAALYYLATIPPFLSCTYMNFHNIVYYVFFLLEIVAFYSVANFL